MIGLARPETGHGNGMTCDNSQVIYYVGVYIWITPRAEAVKHRRKRRKKHYVRAVPAHQRPSVAKIWKAELGLNASKIKLFG